MNTIWTIDNIFYYYFVYPIPHRYFDSVSGNRALMLKIFAAIMVFIVMFIAVS
jgi:hypothetical protein